MYAIHSSKRTRTSRSSNATTSCRCMKVAEQAAVTLTIDGKLIDNDKGKGRNDQHHRDRKNQKSWLLDGGRGVMDGEEIHG